MMCNLEQIFIDNLSYLKNRSLQQHLIKLMLSYKSDPLFHSNICQIVSHLEHLTKNDIFFYSSQQSYDRILSFGDDYVLLGLVYFMPILHEIYYSLHISDHIFSDTISELSRKMLIADQKGLSPFKINYNWLLRVFTLKIIQLGRLQFSFTTFSSGYVFRTDDNTLKWSSTRMNIPHILSPSSPVIEIHVPGGSPLLPELCADSIKTAWCFFDNLGIFFDAFVCRSWLLSQDISPLLKSSSNILQFQKFFELFDCPRPVNEVLYRVFGMSSFESIPPNALHTSLQKRLYSHLQQGHTISGGGGLIIHTSSIENSLNFL